MFFFKQLVAIKGSVTGSETLMLDAGYVYIIKDVYITTYNDGVNATQGIRLHVMDQDGNTIKLPCYLNPSVPDRNQNNYNGLEIRTDASRISMYLEDVAAGNRPSYSYCHIKYEKIEMSALKQEYNIHGGVI